MASNHIMATPDETLFPEKDNATKTERVADLKPAPFLWSHVLTHPFDALWWFGGEHPLGFSTSALLQGAGYMDPAKVSWRITDGADKVEFAGPQSGAEVRIRSKAGSARMNDVAIEMTESTATGPLTFTGNLTVRKPHRLIHRFDLDTAGCPPWAGCSAACPSYWTRIEYRIVDNVGGTIVGATVNEKFPGARTIDTPNDWGGSEAFVSTPAWENTNGTFEDNWFNGSTAPCAGTPAPVAPGAADAGKSIDRLAHEFYVGSNVSGRGVRVQKHTAHRYLGFARHEDITTPAP